MAIPPGGSQDADGVENRGNGDLDRSIEEELGSPTKEGIWTIRKEDKLFELFERCRFLYDTRCAGYKIAGKKTQAHTFFGKKLGFDGKYYEIFIYQNTNV